MAASAMPVAKPDDDDPAEAPRATDEDHEQDEQELLPAEQRGH